VPLSEAPEKIKAYQEKLEKNKIKPDNLPPCPRCATDSIYFKEHAYRNRIFLIIVDMFIKKIFSALLRFKCPGCGKTFTYYPDFAIPYKRHIRQTITYFSRSYVQNPDTTYQKTLMVNNDAPGYPDNQKIMSHTTIHRFVKDIAGLTTCAQKALDLVLQENPTSDICRDLAAATVPAKKYKSTARKNILLQCLRFFAIEVLFQQTFKTSIFTKFALRCTFG